MSEKTPEEIEIEALEEEAAAAEAAAKAAEPSPVERRRIEAIERIRAAKETEAAHAKKRRAVAMAAKETAIRKAITDGSLVKAIDLCDLFPLGAEPAHMPSSGFAVLSNPSPEASARKDASVQTGDKTPHEIGIDLVVACTRFPTTGEDAVKFRSFLEAHAEAVNLLVVEVRDLGGAKSRARPMGRG